MSSRATPSPASPVEAAPDHPLRRILIAGVAILLPATATIYALLWLFRLLDGVLGAAVRPLLPMPIPGLGLVLLTLLVLGLGAVSRTQRGLRAVLWVDHHLAQWPLTAWVYGTATQLAHMTLGDQQRAFRRAVLVEFPIPGSRSLGFVTNDPMQWATGPNGELEALVPVFVPTTPNPTSGFLVFVPEAKLVTAPCAPDAAFRSIVTAGTSAPLNPETAATRRGLSDILHRI